MVHLLVFRRVLNSQISVYWISIPSGEFAPTSSGEKSGSVILGKNLKATQPFDSNLGIIVNGIRWQVDGRNVGQLVLGHYSQ